MFFDCLSTLLYNLKHTTGMSHFFGFCVSMHHHIWVLLGPAWCKLFSAVFITLFAQHVSDVVHIHPQERYKMYMQMVQVSACVSWLVPRRVWIPTCRSNSVIKTALNNWHQAGPNKTQGCLTSKLWSPFVLYHHF